MKMIDNFINNIYGNTQSMMTFYLVLGAFALFFIILIIVTIAKSNKEAKRLRLKQMEDFEEKTSNDVDSAKVELAKDESLTETQIMNNVLLDKEGLDVAKDVTPSPVHIFEQDSEDFARDYEYEDDTKADVDSFETSPNVYLEKEDAKGDIKALENDPVMNEKISNLFDSSVLDDKREEVQEPVEVKMDKEDDKPIDELFNSSRPTLDTVELSSISGMPDGHEFFTVEIPKAKLDDIDTYLNERGQSEKAELAESAADEARSFEEPQEALDLEITEDVVEDEITPISKLQDDGKKEDKVVISNDLMKERLAKLKTHKKESKNEPNDGLESLMKAVGLEDTMVIHGISDEAKTLGR